jgi:extracellular elastinolytic metalloproteinase
VFSFVLKLSNPSRLKIITKGGGILRHSKNKKRMKKTIILLLTIWCTSAFSQETTSTATIQNILLKNSESLAQPDVEQIQVTDKYLTKHNGVEHVYFKQMFRGLEIFNATGSIHSKGDHTFVINENFYRGLNEEAKTLGTWMDAELAFKKAVELLDIEFSNETILVQTEKGLNETIIHNKNYSEEPIKIKKYYLIRNQELVPVWNVSIYTLSKAHWWNIRIHAQSGDFIEKNDWVTSCGFGETGMHDHSNAASNPVPVTNEVSKAAQTLANSSYNALPLRVESPSHGNRVTLTDPDDSLASPFGWHDNNGALGAEYTITRGNNVYARDDKGANNAGGTSPDGGSALKFDHNFDKTKSATLYLDAAITNLFVWNNFMHDVWYHYGFDEASGNFQSKNYGRGGSGARANDNVNADAQDGSGTNNANFSTPPDGTRPRMQMFLWGGAARSLELITVNSPNGVAGIYKGVPAGFGPKLSKTPIVKNLILVDDGSANSSEGCNTLTNASALNGQIALVDRGNCTFVIKVKNAQAAGALAVVVINNLNNAPITMGGNSSGINIPSIMISKSDGEKLKNALKSSSVNISLYDSTSSGTVWLDSDFDNGVIAHEYGHGISIRLSGGPSNSGCLRNQEQMGEGWSDFFGLVMSHEIGAQGSDKRGIGTYLRGQSTNGNGIRPFPYSTNMITNPVTYDHIKLGNFTAPHGVGSAWCTMLWDMYWAFIDEYGFDADMYNGTGGNNIAMQLVLDGLKLQKCNPGFEDGRDAILEADKINNKGKNQTLIWEVFARRGLGFSADQGSTGSKTDGKEAFDLPPFIEGMSFSKTAVSFAKASDTLNYTLTVKNVTDTAIVNIVLSDTLGSDFTFINLTSGQSYTESNGIIQVNIASIAVDDSAVVKFDVKLSSTASFSQVVYTDSMEKDTGFWTKVTDQGSGRFMLVSSVKNSGKFSWFVSDPAAQSDRSLVGEFSLTMTDPVLSFFHWYNTEADWDGAVIEVDGGSGWEDVGHLMLSNGYNSTIRTNQASNISNRDAFSGNSEGFIETVIDLGSYQGKTIKIRFRMVSDGAQGATGWYIDDLTLYDGLIQVENTAFAKAKDLKTLSSSAITTIFEGNKVGIERLKEIGILIYPNPASNERGVANPLLVKANIKLTDLTGKVLFEGELETSRKNIDISAYADGVYMLHINAKGNQETIKLIKTKN